MLHIDGSLGEGGGQILRTALALSAHLGRPFRITNIRARRPKPGLMPQHLAAVRAAAEVCGARVSGDELGSRELRFEPGEVRSGSYRFEVGTAGSTLLVLQAVLLPLCLASGESEVEVAGGTHVPFSPSFHYVQRQLLPLLAQAGARASVELIRAGFYPRGGGLVRVRVEGSSRIHGLRLVERGPLKAVQAVSGVAGLPSSIAERQLVRLLTRLDSAGLAARGHVLEMTSPGKGTFVLVRAEYEHGAFCATSLGERGKPAERVADEAADELASWLPLPGAVDPYAADQLLPFLALGETASSLAVPRLTRHLASNALIAGLFRPGAARVQGVVGSSGVLHAASAGDHPRG